MTRGTRDALLFALVLVLVAVAASAAHADPVLDGAADRARVAPVVDRWDEAPAARTIARQQVNRWHLVAFLTAAAKSAAQQQGGARAAARAMAGTRAPLPRSASDAAFLACTRAHESDTAGGYQATDHGDGGAENMGAYQFDQRTWDSVASRIAPSLVGVRPDQASPADQDALATQLYHERGSQPWGGRC